MNIERNHMTELAVRDILETELSPKEFTQALEYAAAKAKALKEVVDAQKLSVKVGQSEHLRVEGWITIGEGYGLASKTSTKQLFWNETHTRVIGAEVHATIVDRNGVERGGADQVCFNYEQGKEDHTASQLIGMASTRAVSRAFNQLLRWVVVLAGYSPTPWEEIAGTPLGEAGSMNVCPLEGHGKLSWRPAGRDKETMHIVEGLTGPKGGKIWCKQADVLANLNDAFRPVTEGYDRDELVQLLKDAYGGRTWGTMTPVEKLDAIQTLQTSPEEPSVDEQSEEAPY